jgi:hypothetical protein
MRAVIMGIYFHESAEVALILLVNYWKLLFKMLWGPDGIGILHSLLILPALATHIWLPLLAVAAASVKAANYFLWSVGKMQWFLRQGHEHPLEAIGYVAGGIVFILAAIVHWLI